MKAASAQLITLLNNSVQFKLADLLKISNIAGGSTLLLQSSDFSITKGADVYDPAIPVEFTRGQTTRSIGLEVDELDFELFGYYTGIGGIPLQQVAANGGFDGARVELYRAVMAEFGDVSAGFVWLFSGRVADVDTSRNRISVKAHSDLELLDSQFPRRLYQPGCTNTLFDAGCGVVRASYVTAATTLAGSTKTAIAVTNASATGYFDLGTVLYTSGQNTGTKRTIKAFTAGSPASVALSLPLPYVPTAGDTFQLVPGCDKTKLGGCTKFGNTGRFAGCRFIPRPETVR